MLIIQLIILLNQVKTGVNSLIYCFYLRHYHHSYGMTLQEIFIHNLKFYRKQKGLTQNELTLSIDKSYNYINGVEQKKCFPPPDVIERIATALGIKAHQLFMEDGCPETAMQFNADKYIERITADLHQRLKEDIRREVQEVFARKL